MPDAVDPARDPLVEVLRLVRVEGALFSRARCGGAWGVHTRGASGGIFHAVVRGHGHAAALGPDGAVLARATFGPGDVLVFPHGHAHTLTFAPDAPTTWLRELPVEPGPLPTVVAGPAGALDTELLCGTLHLQGDAVALLGLPPLLHAAGSPTVGWLEACVAQMAAEVASGEPGADAVVARLAELCFLQALRAGVGQGHGAGWLRALGDPALARALALLHGAPGRAWSVDELARRAGLSRTAFFERFSRVVGEAPAAYLLRWRMTLARHALRDPRTSIPELAGRVGYGSEAAFNRAFKRFVGQPPGAWRRAA